MIYLLFFIISPPTNISFLPASDSRISGLRLYDFVYNLLCSCNIDFKMNSGVIVCASISIAVEYSTVEIYVSVLSHGLFQFLATPVPIAISSFVRVSQSHSRNFFRACSTAPFHRRGNRSWDYVVTHLERELPSCWTWVRLTRESVFSDLPLFPGLGVSEELGCTVEGHQGGSGYSSMAPSLQERERGC